MWREVMPNDKQYSEAAEAKLAAKADRVLALTTAQTSALPDFGQGEAPTEPLVRDLWFYRACRQIEAYNESIQKCMTPAELENAQAVNTYREYLGILPYEYDPRLVESARGHSKEMVRMKYFAHDSPVEANKTPWDRMKAAKYENGAGENIAAGTSSGTAAFWMWFDSPGHHQNMARAGSTALGVGVTAATWTQNMGAGPRAMLTEKRKIGAGNT